jgi:hypothetical protein
MNIKKPQERSRTVSRKINNGLKKDHQQSQERSSTVSRKINKISLDTNRFLYKFEYLYFFKRINIIYMNVSTFIELIDNIEIDCKRAVKQFSKQFKAQTQNHKSFLNELNNMVNLPTTQHMIAYLDRLTEDYFGFSIEHYINTPTVYDEKANIKNICSGKCKYLNKKGEECLIKPHDKNDFCAKHRYSKQAK